MVQAILTTLPMLVCAMITIMLILEQQRRTDGLLHWLIAWAASATLLYAGHFVFFHHAVNWLPVTDTIYVAMNLWVYPLYLIYISELTDRIPLSQRRYATGLLLLPGIIASICCGMLYAAMSPTETAAFIHEYLYKNDIDELSGLAVAQATLHNACHMLFAIQVIGVAVAGIRKVRHYNHITTLFYADTDDKEARGLTTILTLMPVTVFFSITVNNIGRSWFVDSMRLALPSIAFSCLLFAIGWTGMQQRFSARDILRQHAEKEPAPVIRANTIQLCAKLEALMDEEKLFLQHDLKLDDVSKRLGTNRTYLLQALSTGMHMTFKEYINRKRIMHADRLMANNPTLSKIEVATLSGYSSMSSFYRNYNQYHS